MKILVLGLGNLLLRDEGVGLHVLRRLETELELPEGLELLDGGTSGMDLLNDLIDRDAVIVIDAIKSAAAPGTVVRLADDEVPAFFQTRFSPHQIGLVDVLAALELMEAKPREVILIGIVPEDLELGLELSPRVAEGAARAFEMALRELRRLGVSARPQLAAAV